MTKKNEDVPKPKAKLTEEGDKKTRYTGISHGVPVVQKNGRPKN